MCIMTLKRISQPEQHATEPYDTRLYRKGPGADSIRIETPRSVADWFDFRPRQPYRRCSSHVIHRPEHTELNHSIKFLNNGEMYKRKASGIAS